MDPQTFVDRSERGKLRFTGEQRAWFLDQILTQQFEGAKPGRCLDAALLSVHGRMHAYAEFLITEDSILGHFERSLLESFPDALRKYVFATRVEIEDVTDEYGLVLIVHEDAGSLADAYGGEHELHWTSSLGTPAAYVWVPRDGVKALSDHLVDGGIKPGSERELEAIRIGNGIARWGYEMNEKTFPQEAGVDGRAVHFEKGCYLGQEAMAKIHFRGKVNRKLVRLEADGPLEAGAEVNASEGRIGNVTSAADSSGLAVVKHTIEAGTEVRAGDVPARVAS